MQDEECVVSDEEEAQVTKYNRKKTKAKVGDSDSENDIYVNGLGVGGFLLQILGICLLKKSLFFLDDDWSWQ